MLISWAKEMCAAMGRRSRRCEKRDIASSNYEYLHVNFGRESRFGGWYPDIIYSSYISSSPSIVQRQNQRPSFTLLKPRSPYTSISYISYASLGTSPLAIFNNSASFRSLVNRSLTMTRSLSPCSLNTLISAISSSSSGLGSSCLDPGTVRSNAARISESCMLRILSVCVGGEASGTRVVWELGVAEGGALELDGVVEFEAEVV